MQAKVINPYTLLGQKQRDALDYIIANLPPAPTFQQLNEQLAAAFFTPNPQNPTTGEFLTNYIETVLPHAYNGYVHGGLGTFVHYSDTQQLYITQMVEGIRSVPFESIGEYLENLEEGIVSGKLRYEEQIPLLLAVTLGRSSNEYWLAQLATPGAWAGYLNADNALNYAQLAGWVTAAMQGVLLTYGLMKPPQLQPVDIITATIASTGVTAGKVLFKWLGRVVI